MPVGGIVDIIVANHYYVHLWWDQRWSRARQRGTFGGTHDGGGMECFIGTITIIQAPVWMEYSYVPRLGN